MAEELKKFEELRRKKEEAKRKDEEDRMAAEREFLERHERERKLSTGRSASHSVGGSGGRYTPPSGSSSIVDSESEQEKRKRMRTKDSPENKEKKRPKARKSDDTDSDQEDREEGHESDPLKCLTGILKKMRSWFKQPTIMKMVTKPQTERFERYLDGFQEELVNAREERARLETRVEERSALVEIVRSTVREELEKGKDVGVKTIQSYADAAGRKVPKVSGLRGPMLPPPKLVVIRQDNKESEEVKKKLKELVKPSEIGLKVKRVSKIKNGVIVEAESDGGVEKLLKNDALQKAGMKVGKPNRRKPIIMVYDVKAELKDDEIREEIFTRNMEESDIQKKEFKEEFQVRHRYKDGKGGLKTGNRCHLVVECSVRVRNWLRRKGRVFIEWESCRIKDFVDLARCYKCQRYGHVAKHCNAAKSSCSYCAEEHDFKDCRNKGKPCCMNCKREGRVDTKHPATWRECPVYERAAKRYNEQIDYGV